MNRPPILQRRHTYEITRLDLLVAQLAGVVYSRLSLGIVLVVVLFCGLLGFISVVGEEVHLLVRLIMATFMMVGAALFFAVTYLILAVVVAYARRHRGVIGSHTLVITDEGLLETTKYNETLHRWAGVHRLRQTSRYLFIYLTEALFHQIPTRSFSSKAELDEFWSKIVQKSRCAEPGAAPEPPPAAAVREASETMNTKPESDALADSGGR